MNMNADRTSVLRLAAGLLFGVREVVGLTRLREMAG
jgi:hypothetical protein